MGMSADVLAIGGFRQELIPFLTHAPQRYEGTRPGAMIVECLFEEFGSQGRTASHELAAALGAKAWDFSTHELRLERIDLEELESLVGRPELEKFKALHAAGFRFFYRPNG